MPITLGSTEVGVQLWPPARQVLVVLEAAVFQVRNATLRPNHANAATALYAEVVTWSMLQVERPSESR